ncbi:MAG: translation initiation factor IF-2 N-terminal domain-containing protein, partial [Halobacteriovoraceae bacterium]|nr:translation initiation factor IF-2 N-terminal domain-containing protein [Halobacteriovoraceae bacterium]
MPKKVFELAKELNLRPLQMVETLKKKGFNARNHMSVLSDTDISKIKAMFKEETSENKPKKKPTKKTKTVAKNTNKKKSPIIRRRASNRKEAPPKEKASSAAASTSLKEDKKKENISKPSINTSAQVKKDTSTTTTDPALDSSSSSEDNRQPSKKRLGGLASMMSEKKSSFSRTQILNQTRADSELKSYATLGTLGRPIYSQVKKKKAFHGAAGQTEITEVKQSKRVIQLHKGGSIKELAQKLGIKVQSLINKVLELNLLVGPDDFVGIILAGETARLYDYRVEDISFKEEAIIENKEVTEKEREKLPLRDPV